MRLAYAQDIFYCYGGRVFSAALGGLSGFLRADPCSSGLAIRIVDAKVGDFFFIWKYLKDFVCGSLALSRKSCQEKTGSQQGQGGFEVSRVRIGC